MKTFADHLGLQWGKRSTSKPRKRGLTMVMDQGWPNSFAQGMLEGYGHNLDILKLWDVHLGQPVENVLRKVEIYRSHDVIVQPGGLYMEMARQQGRAVEALKTIKEMGFTAVEISSTTGSRKGVSQEERDLIARAKDMGFTVFGEVGRKFFDGDETRLTNDTIDLDVTIGEFKGLLEAGIDKVYWEGHLTRMVMGDTAEEIIAKAGTGTQQVLQVAREVGVDNIIFEVSGLRPRANREVLQFWLVRLFGPEVNFANLPIEELGNLEAIRSGNAVIHGFGNAGNYPFIRALAEGRADNWWRA